MESYRMKITDTYSAIVYKNKKTGKLGLVHNSGSYEFLRGYWLGSEPNYEIIECKPIPNVTTLKYFVYWDKLPRAYRNSHQRCMKFDFFKYVLGADLSDKYRDVVNIADVKENDDELS